MSHKRTIKIFFEKTHPKSFRSATLSNWTGKALICPRSEIKAVEFVKAAKETSIYFLVNNDDLSKPKIYIGEANNLNNRLGDHAAKKDFWNFLIAFTCTDQQLTKAHVKYLESKCIDLAISVKGSILENGKYSKPYNLPPEEIESSEHYLDNLKFLLLGLGFNFLNEIKSKKPAAIEYKKSLFFYTDKKKQIDATGEMNEGDSFIIYADSKISKEISPSAADLNLQEKINTLIKKRILTEHENFYLFIKDYVFSSPSAAATIVTGCSSNGWTEWRNKTDQTLDEFYRSKNE